MTQFLLTLFLKNKNDPTDPSIRPAIGRIAGITGICCNCLLALIKLLAGLLSHSIAILADAANNLSDAISSIVTLVGFRMAQRPADQDHPYGHARYEYLAGLIVSELILVMGLELAKSSFQKILHPMDIPFSPISMGILVLSIGIKLWMSHFYNTLSKAIHSTTLKAAAADSRNDVLSTTAILASCLASVFTPFRTDGIAGLVVAGLILLSGFRIAKETVSPLLGMRADQNLVQEITDLVHSHQGILGFHDLLVHDYGPGKCFASLHAEVDSRMDPLECHDLLNHIEGDAWEQLHIHLVIHTDPVDTRNQQWDTLRELANQAIQQLDFRLSIHDFRILQSDDQPTLSFDLSLPYDFPESDDSVQLQIRNVLQQSGIQYPTEINLDRE